MMQLCTVTSFGCTARLRFNANLIDAQELNKICSHEPDRASILCPCLYVCPMMLNTDLCKYLTTVL